jgi:hypothetical protein
METMYRYCLVALLTGLGACATYSSESTTMDGAATHCEEPRPQVCTMEYRPVCANLSDGGVKTYASGCTACSDARVVSWVEDECPE